MTAATEDNILAQMPYPELTKIRGEADFTKLNKLRLQVYKNAAAIECPHGNENGHLGLVMPPDQYEERYGVPFESAEDPGAHPTDIRANSSHAYIARQQAIYQNAKKAFETEKIVQKIIKKQLKEALPTPIYYQK